MKNFINKILDVPKLIKTIWVILWLILLILLIMKFCFGIWYPIVVKNDTMLTVFNYIDNHKWLNITIMGIFYLFSLNLLCLTNMGKRKYDNIGMLIVINFLICLSFLIKNLNSIAGNIFEIVMLFVSFSFYNYAKHSFDKHWKDILIPIINYALLNLWQLLIYLVRDLKVSELESYGFTIGIILMLDYYIFLTINWIGVSYMGLWSAGWLFGKDITVLKAEREKELAKKEPNMDLIAEIDSRIEKLEKEGK